jgi:hypothetical protein
MRLDIKPGAVRAADLVKLADALLAARPAKA